MPGSKKTEDAFQRKSKLPATFFDLTMAFDKSWKEGLIIKLIQKRDWRQNAEADKGLSEQKTWKDQTSEEQKKKKIKSKMVTISEEAPQVGTLYHTLFITFINDLPKQFALCIHRALHADDRTMWTQSEYTGETKMRMLETINRVDDWAEIWRVQIRQPLHSSSYPLKWRTTC